MGPKSENVSFSSVLPLLFEGSRLPREDSENELPSGPCRLGGGRGRVNPPPRRLVWRFWRFGGFGNWFKASTRLEAQGLGGFNRNGALLGVCIAHQNLQIMRGIRICR